jgi:hypothetical protein
MLLVFLHGLLWVRENQKLCFWPVSGGSSHTLKQRQKQGKPYLGRKNFYVRAIAEE